MGHVFRRRSVKCSSKRIVPTGNEGLLRRKAFRAIALTLGLGCGGDDQPTPAMTMVTACTPVTSVPDSSGGQIGSFAVGPRGYIAWTDRAIGNHLIIGTPDSIRLVGREGSGPGEFRMIAGIGWRGDTVWTSDLRLQRFQTFSATGELIASVSVPVRATFAWVGGDTLIGLPVQSVADSAYPIVRHLQGRTDVDTLAVFHHPKVPPLEIRMSNDQSIVGPQPLAERVTAARSPDGRRWCALEPAEEPAMRLVCGAPDGRLLVDTIITIPGQPLADEDLAEVLDRFGEIPGISREKLKAALHVPRFLPRVDRMMIADDGRIWLLRSSSDSVAVWQRLAPDGSSEGSVTLLPRQRALLLLGNSLYVAAADENDVQHIERCSL